MSFSNCRLSTIIHHQYNLHSSTSAFPDPSNHIAKWIHSVDHHVDKCKEKPFLLISELVLNMSNYENENDVCGIFTMFNSKLDIINFYLLSDFYFCFNHLIIYYYAMLQKYDCSVRSTLKLITFYFINGAVLFLY